MKQLDAAEVDARSALEAITEDRSELGAELHLILGDITYHRAEFDNALHHARLGVEIAEECAGSSHPLFGVALQPSPPVGAAGV